MIYCAKVILFKKEYEISSQKIKDKAKIFSNLMMHGKINAAVKMLSNWSTCIRSVDGKVLKKLQNKHPDPSPIKEGTLLHGPINRVLPSYSDSIDEAMVLKAASLTKGARGPSQLDSKQYGHILSGCKFKKENKELREHITST